MTLNQLLNAPQADDLDAMSEWFANVKLWAENNKKKELTRYTDSALFFCNNKNRVVEFRRKILSMLKAISKEFYDMGDKIKVFVVHGHDNELKESVARYLERLGFEAIILHEQINGGQTIIEKLESATANIKYAVVLYSGDDEGANGQRRARQNVIFEHGYLTGKLGRKNICVIMDDNIEHPSDNEGVVYVSRQEWKIKLADEMKGVGLPVDKNRV